MVAISLLDIPPEIQLQIVESVETRQVLKALSLTSRSLRSIAQSLLFERFEIDLGKELKGSINDLLANPRICTAIRFLELRGYHSMDLGRHHYDDEEKLSLIQKLLPEMVGLREVAISRLYLSRTFMDAFVEVAAKAPLRVNLYWNIYPPCIGLAPNTSLRISHLHLAPDVDHSLDFYRLVLSASAAVLTELHLSVDGDGLMKLADIELPALHDVTLSITTDNESSRKSVFAFITAQKTIRKLDLSGTVRPLPPLPPNALPNLRELNAPSELINQLVPGRPLEAIEVSFPKGSNQGWLGEEVARSTARIRTLRVQLDSGILVGRMVQRMVTILPSLERLWLSVFDDELLDVLEALTSLKCLTHLRIRLYLRNTWIKYNAKHINSIATQLREANSCFSFIEIEHWAASEWKSTVSVWSEVSACFTIQSALLGTCGRFPRNSSNYSTSTQPAYFRMPTRHRSHI